MKKSDVQIGATYLVKVAGNQVPVRITAEHDGGGWEGKSVKTGKTIRIKSPQRLRKRITDPEQAKAVHAADQENARLRDERAASEDGMTASERAMADSAPAPAPGGELVVFRMGKGQSWRWRLGDQVCLKQYMAREQAERAAKKAHPDATLRVESTEGEPKAKATKDAKAKPERDTGERAATGGKRLSLIDAAAQVLADAKQPLSTREMVERVTERGLWTPGEGKTPANTLYSAILREIKVKGDDARFTKVERGRFALTPGRPGRAAASGGKEG